MWVQFLLKLKCLNMDSCCYQWFSEKLKEQTLDTELVLDEQLHSE